MMHNTLFLTGFILIVSVLATVLPDVYSLFIFDRGAFAQGEIWRLVTGHFVHFSYSHLAYNFIAFGLVGYVLDKKGYANILVLVFCMTIAISVSLFVFYPQMNSYGGLSGIACGVIYYTALMGTNEEKPWQTICVLALIVLPLKVGFEFISQSSVLAHWGQQDFVLMPTSHLVGCCVAVTFYLMQDKRLIKCLRSKIVQPI